VRLPSLAVTADSDSQSVWEKSMGPLGWVVHERRLNRRRISFIT
jgi:hypothetical protein